MLLLFYFNSKLVYLILYYIILLYFVFLAFSLKGGDTATGFLNYSFWISKIYYCIITSPERLGVFFLGEKYTVSTLVDQNSFIAYSQAQKKEGFFQN